MRIPRGFAGFAVITVGVCIAAFVVASRAFPMRSPPELDLEEWLDVWATYKLEAIPTRPEPHVVQPGETIWDIAEAYKLPGDMKMTVDIIRELNSLWGPRSLRLRPGQRLKVPEPDWEQWPLAIRHAWERQQARGEAG